MAKPLSDYSRSSRKHDRSQAQAKDYVQSGNTERFIPELDNPIIEQEVR